MQVGDSIIYKGKLHHVKNFGLLSTQFIRNDGCKIWVRTSPPASPSSSTQLADEPGDQDLRSISGAWFVVSSMVIVLMDHPDIGTAIFFAPPVLMNGAHDAHCTGAARAVSTSLSHCVCCRCRIRH